MSRIITLMNILSRFIFFLLIPHLLCNLLCLCHCSNYCPIISHIPLLFSVENVTLDYLLVPRTVERRSAVTPINLDQRRSWNKWNYCSSGTFSFSYSWGCLLCTSTSGLQIGYRIDDFSIKLPLNQGTLMSDNGSSTDESFLVACNYEKGSALGTGDGGKG